MLRSGDAALGLPPPRRVGSFPRLGARFGGRPFLLRERQDKDGRFVFSQRCFPGWLGPDAALVCTPVPAGAGAATIMFLDSAPEISWRLGDV